LNNGLGRRPIVDESLVPAVRSNNRRSAAITTPGRALSDQLIGEKDTTDATERCRLMGKRMERMAGTNSNLVRQTAHQLAASRRTLRDSFWLWLSQFRSADRWCVTALPSTRPADAGRWPHPLACRIDPLPRR
jgi:hypothetical protein